MARSQYGTEIPWLVDSMSNELKHAFGDRNNSEFVISPEGEVLIARAWSDPVQLRLDLEALVGAPETVTEPMRRNTPSANGDSKVARGVVDGVTRPSGSQALVVKSHDPESAEPHYLKLRVETNPRVAAGESGSLHFSFQLDPIHRVHWNNLAPPLVARLATESEVELSLTELSAEKVEQVEADGDPREFLVEVAGSQRSGPIEVAVDFYACDDEDRWCKALTQTFTVEWELDRDAGRVSGGGGSGRRDSPGAGSKGKGKGKMQPDPSRLLSRFDANEDGRISAEEASGRLAERFDTIDADEDGFVTPEELKAAFAQMPRP
ncbi:MAG: hypothetical protein AAF236_07365 [Verrucomicrobiota bacterium]